MHIFSRPDLNPIRPCSVKIWGPFHKFSDINVHKLNCHKYGIQHYNLQLYAVLPLLPDLRCGFLNSEDQYNSCFAIRHTGPLVSCYTKWTFKCCKEASTSQKMLRFCLTHCGLWVPHFVGDPVRPKMLNMRKYFQNIHIMIER